MPLPPWAVASIAALAVVGVALAIYFAVVQPHLRDDQQLRQEGGAKLQQAQSRVRQLEAQQIIHDKELADLQRESARHFDEPRTTSQVADGKLSVDFFASDGCVRVMRQGAGPNLIKWFLNPARIPNDPAPGRVNGEIKPVVTGARITLFPALYAAEHLTQNIALCGGRCPPQHPGRFDTRTGERRGCWVQMWRRWPDGCEQYQWFNSCYSYWDEDGNHRPRIYWTCCNH